MLLIIIFFNLVSAQFNDMIFEFKEDSNLERWQVVDDVVMGGRSNGTLELNENGNGVFKGNVSIENNGGFSSIQLRLETKKTDGKASISLRLKGDGSDFQFRVKASTRDRHSYIYNFKTSGDWETISIPLSDMSPSFRGYSLQIPNFNHNKIEQIGVLKSSKENNTFKLEIKHIYLVN